MTWPHTGILRKVRWTRFLFTATPRRWNCFENGKSLGIKAVDPDTYQAVYLVDYKKGELKANAFIGKKIVASHNLKTAGNPDKLVLINEREALPVDQDRLIFLSLEVQDEKGTRCPHARDEITVELSGAGELLGLDSGDQFSHELYKQNKRKAYEGRLLLTIRPKGEGEITVRCSAGDLTAATINIRDWLLGTR